MDPTAATTGTHTPSSNPCRQGQALPPFCTLPPLPLPPPVMRHTVVSTTTAAATYGRQLQQHLSAQLVFREPAQLVQLRGIRVLHKALQKAKQANPFERERETIAQQEQQKNRLFSVIIKREKKRDARHHDNNIDNARVSVERRQIESGDARRLRRERGGVDLLQPGSQKSDCQHFYGASSSVTLSCHFSKWDHNDNALCRVVCLEKHLLRSGSRERARGRGFPARLARSRSRAEDGLEDGERKRLTSSIRWSHRRHLLQASFFPHFKLSRASSLSLSLFRSHSFSLLFSRSFSLVSSRLMWIVRVNTDQYSSLRVT